MSYGLSLAGWLACTPVATVPSETEDTAAGAAPLLEFTGERPKNVLILSIDTLVRARVGRYAGTDVSPTLDRLSEEGFTFDNHRSCSSWTYPSVSCVMTGQQNHETGFIPAMVKEGSDTMPQMPDEAVLFPEVFSAAGYDTRLRSSNWYLSSNFNTDQGYADSAFGGEGEGPSSLSIAMTDSETLTEPFLAHVHFIEPHAPLTAPAKYNADEINDLPPLPWDLTNRDGTTALLDAWETISDETKAVATRHLELLYDAEIRDTDEKVRLLLQDYEEAGLLENTLVMVWSDHGEQFFEHGSLGHAGSLYGEENDAIAIFWAVNLVPGSSTRPSTHADLGPTLLEAMDFPVPEEMTGRVLGTEPAEPVFSVLTPAKNTPSSAIEWKGYKLIYWWNGRAELYHRETDPTESNNVFERKPKVAERLWEILEPVVAQQAALTTHTTTPLTF